ncbi:hypothetical protein B0H67DRAFT_590349 [Lasiosphaeris hirsuta]|uniref:Uncharacterized protein n=1 Tax=Lasiosphaeris hirsuta TaxID=260670 RepID=A0AA40A380_9PEZI|nr:hypothetical protein B0H67DRAFT_590349 [Lasiosphaeris hirsuta]
MFRSKPTPEGWYEVQVRPSYNNSRKLKKILDDMFPKSGRDKYKLQADRDRWIIMTTRRLTPAELENINKPRADALAQSTKPTPKPSIRPWAVIFRALGIRRQVMGEAERHPRD